MEYRGLCNIVMIDDNICNIVMIDDNICNIVMIDDNITESPVFQNFCYLGVGRGEGGIISN
jgi:hypothetical protein